MMSFYLLEEDDEYFYLLEEDDECFYLLGEGDQCLYLLEEDDECFYLLEEDDEEAGEGLGGLGQEDGGGGEELRAGASLDVSHQQDQQGILRRQQQKAQNL
jgi:hypothetical protein